VLVTPLTQTVFDEQWEAMMGDIPPAIGLADLDELYPEVEEPEAPLEPPMPFPSMMPPMPEAVEMPLVPLPGGEALAPVEEKPPKKKLGWFGRFLLLIIIATAAGGVYVAMYGIPEELPFEIPSF
jgi:hypothetical protein